MVAVEEAVLFVAVSCYGLLPLNCTKEQFGMLMVEWRDLDVELELKRRCCGSDGSVDDQEVHVAPRGPRQFILPAGSVRINKKRRSLERVTERALTQLRPPFVSMSSSWLRV